MTSTQELHDGSAELAVRGIDTVEWQGYEGYADGKTNLSGNKFYAERNQPEGRDDDELHDKVDIEVTLTAPVPAGKSATVWMTVFDPDHFSSDPTFDPNGITEPNDNLAAGGGAPGGSTRNVGATFSNGTELAEITISAMEDSGRVTMRVSARQPTNNFVVAASKSDWRIQAMVFAPDGHTLLTGAGGVAAPETTPILTVWRTLYVEADWMENPVPYFGKAPTKYVAGTFTLRRSETRITMALQMRLRSTRHFHDPTFWTTNTGSILKGVH